MRGECSLSFQTPSGALRGTPPDKLSSARYSVKPSNSRSDAFSSSC